MGALVISILTVALVLACAFIILIVLMQRTSSSGGMGAALGGGATEQVFGAETTNVLTKGTIYGTIVFFVLSLVLYLIYQSATGAGASADDAKSLAGEDESEPALVEPSTFDGTAPDVSPSVLTVPEETTAPMETAPDLSPNVN